jgi:glucokinase
MNIAHGNINAITAETVTIAAQNGDKMANSLINGLVDLLVAGITSVVNMLGPERIILGGGIIEGMPQLVPRIEEGLKQSALKAATGAVNIFPSIFHNDSGTIGAATYALHMLNSK